MTKTNQVNNRRGFEIQVKQGDLVEICLKDNRFFSFDPTNQRWVVDIGYKEGGTARRYERKRPSEIRLLIAFYQGKEGIPQGEKRRDDPEWYAFEAATGGHPMNIRTSDLSEVKIIDFSPAKRYDFTN